MIYLVDNYHPKMCERNLRASITEYPSFLHFAKMFSKVLNQGLEFQIKVQKDNLDKFCKMMKLNSTLLKPGPQLEVEDLEVNDVVFCICPTPTHSTIFRCFLITIHTKETTHAKKFQKPE